MKYFSVRNKAIVSELVRTDFKVRYQGSILGYGWSLLRPLFLFTVLYVIFVYVIPIGRDVENYPVYLLSGIILWNFFGESTTQGLTSIVSKGDLIRKINIPKYLLVISSAISALINLFFGLIVIVFFALINGMIPTLQWLIAIPLIIEIFILSVSISLITSSLYVKFRDISYIWEVFLQIGFYASAIIFPLTSVSSNIQKWFFINPITQIVQDMRYVIATHDTITIWSTVSLQRASIPFLIIVILSVIGVFVFKKRSRTFAEDI